MKIIVERFHLLFVVSDVRTVYDDENFARLFYFSGVLFFWLLNQIVPLCGDLLPTNKLNKCQNEYLIRLFKN